MDGRTRAIHILSWVFVALAAAITIGGLIYDGLREGEHPDLSGMYLAAVVPGGIGAILGYEAKRRADAVSRNGQFSIPADTRARGNARRVVVVDLGDRVVMRPLGDRPVDDLNGNYRGRGPSTDRARKQARAEDAAHDGSR